MARKRIEKITTDEKIIATMMQLYGITKKEAWRRYKFNMMFKLKTEQTELSNMRY